METVRLNPNPTARNPASQQGTMGTQSDGSQDFSPLMDEAVENIENGQSPQDPKTQQNTDQPENSSVDILQDDNDIGLSSQAILFAETASTKNNLNTVGNDKSSTDKTPVISSPLDKASMANPTIVIPTDDGSTLKMAVEGTSNAVTPSKAESHLLQQIHQILDQGKENGPIVIRGNELPGGKLPGQTNNLQNLSNPILPDTNAENGTRQTGISLPIVENSSRNSPQFSNLEGAKQDVSEQFFNAKLGQSKRNTNDSSEQRNSEQKGFNQTNKGELQQVATSQGNTVTETKLAESTFGQKFGQISSTTTQTTSIEGKFTPLTHIPVPQKEIVNNLIQRFNSNPRLQTSKISMQLHPVELGALKINILVKNDSISANIVAQSRQVMETLEKNMPRLRAVLEDQGFKIDAFEIIMDSDGGNQKELFQKQFSSQQQKFTFNESSSKKNESFDAVLDSQEESAGTDEETSGVNLRV
jgi:flagellar hook-length control protein FliK